MAYWNRKRGKQVYVYTHRDGIQKALPRSETRHLDGEPDHNIDTWVNNWSLAHEHLDRTNQVVLTDTKSLELVEHFCIYLKSTGKHRATINEHRGNLVNYIFPFFIYKSGLTDPQLWPTRSIRLLNYLREERGLRPKHINACNTALRQLWKWMTEERIVSEASLPLRTGGKISRPDTPLREILTPEKILNHKFTESAAEILALLGYFFSLRPQEIIALKPRDFRAGIAASQLECCKVMSRADLYGKFAVVISRQRERRETRTPKSGSKGVVACFDRRAAARIVGILNDLPPDEYILPYGIDWYYHFWKRKGYPGVTLKDLRRASLYYLGHYTAIEPVGLMNHARHSSLHTTSLYLRRPEEMMEDWKGLDLES